MSIYRYAGREKLADGLFYCLCIDLVICGLFLLLNLIVAYDYFLIHMLEITILIFGFCFYVAILDTIRQKMLEYRDGFSKYLAEVITSLYLYFHCILYILIIGSFLIGIYLGVTGIQISSDFLMSWAIIIATGTLGIFYLKYREHRRSFEPKPEKTDTDPLRYYPDEQLTQEGRYPDDNRRDNKGGKERLVYDGDGFPWSFSSHSVDMNCYICGKRDIMPMKGRDGRYYCQDHILPENRIFSDDSKQYSNKFFPKPDVWCENCQRNIYHNDIIQCGPCGRLFCIHCWESHRWIHGKAPAFGISYRADGTYSGYDGTESYKKN
jgi:hypothetical protein